MIICDVPIRRVQVRVNGGELETLLRLEPGFWIVRKPNEELLGSPGHGPTLVSNPLIEVFAVGDWTDVTANEPIFIRLTEPQASNPGTNDEQASLTENLATVS